MGISTAKNFSSLNIGTTVLNVDCDIRGLVPGKYFALLVLYQTNDMGTSEDLDCVHPAFVFEVQDTQGKMDIVWNYHNWGRMRLPDMTVKNNGDV